MHGPMVHVIIAARGLMVAVQRTFQKNSMSTLNSPMMDIPIWHVLTMVMSMLKYVVKPVLSIPTVILSHTILSQCKI